jgi:hypothetical protein
MIRAAVIALFAAMALSLSAWNARAQEGVSVTDALAKNPYALAMLEVLDRWDSGTLEFSKAAAEPEFERRLDKYKALPSDRFVVERWFTVEEILDQWKQLPDTLKPELKLSTGARLILAAAVVDKSAVLESFVKPYPDELQSKLASSLYLTLAAAQQEALEQGKKVIDATAVQRAGVRFFSLGWPFCCADEFS